ncbi:unnamed protein product, partial [Scytosiphon promiscuus]
MSGLLNKLKKNKTPDQLVAAMVEALDQGQDAQLAKRLSQIKFVLYGEEERDPDEARCKEFSVAIRRSEAMPRLIESLPALPFEARKDVSQIFSNLVRKNIESFVEYVEGEPLMVKNMIGAYGNTDIALHGGAMLRECIRYENLARMTLYDETLWLFFDQVCVCVCVCVSPYVHLPNFDVASDAFVTLRDLLTRHKTVASDFLASKFETVFDKYNILLRSANYVTRRQSLKLLGELLLDRSNFQVMMRYIQDKENLKMMMNLLRDKSPNIQYEAFHVFKVFVANPKKPREVTKILVNNKAKLIAYLENFHNDRDDAQFKEEKNLLVTTLSQLQLDDASGGGGSSGGGGNGGGNSGSASHRRAGSTVSSAGSSGGGGSHHQRSSSLGGGGDG